MRPFPDTSQATHARGAKFHHFVAKPEFPDGKPGSPGYRKPAGAFTNWVLFTPRRKLSSLKLVTEPCVTFCPENGSHRRPAFTVIRSVARQPSCAYRPSYNWWKVTPT